MSNEKVPGVVTRGADVLVTMALKRTYSGDAETLERFQKDMEEAMRKVEEKYSAA